MFEIDPAKSVANAEKHGIDFLAAQALWERRRLEILSRPGPPEARWLVIGMISGKYWTAS